VRPHVEDLDPVRLRLELVRQEELLAMPLDPRTLKPVLRLG
jgi:hypothetical protein